MPPSPLTNPNENTIKQQNTNQQELREIRQLWKELGFPSSSSQLQRTLTVSNNDHTDSIIAPTTGVWQPILCIGFGAALLFNIGILCSLPPVLRGRGKFPLKKNNCRRRLWIIFVFAQRLKHCIPGAPFLPTYEKNMIHMFQQLRNEPQFMKRHHRVMMNHKDCNGNENENIVFVDLGSGDGRIVFHAAYREQLFTKCIGYEINPFLHYYAIIKQQYYRMIFPRRNHNATSALSATEAATILPPIQTEFYIRDLWKVNLQNVNVVAVVRILFEIGSRDILILSFFAKRKCILIIPPVFFCHGTP